MTTYSVWGKTYETVREMRQQVREVKALNVAFGESDDRVSEINALAEEIEAAEKRFAEIYAAQQRPFYVLTRYATKGGELKKGRRTFKTRAEQSRYMRTAPDHVAITGWN